MGSVQITAFHPDKATYKPGEPVELLITLTNPLTRSLSVDVTASVKYLTEEVAPLHHMNDVTAFHHINEVTALAQPAELPPGGRPCMARIAASKSLRMTVEMWPEAANMISAIRTKFGPSILVSENAFSN